MSVNSMYFESLEEAMKFIQVLHENSENDSTHYNDIHTYIEEHAYIVEWVQIPHDHAYGGQFKFVDEDQDVMNYRSFPDDHAEWFLSEADYQDALEEWLKENPGWKQNQWGHWYNVEEQKAWEDSLEKAKEN